tara:strand:- start:267 stop:425 length:159 start_codon:yes stop_codon:yes gene_type:complete
MPFISPSDLIRQITASLFQTPAGVAAAVIRILFLFINFPELLLLINLNLTGE